MPPPRLFEWWLVGSDAYGLLNTFSQSSCDCPRPESWLCQNLNWTLVQSLMLPHHLLICLHPSPSYSALKNGFGVPRGARHTCPYHLISQWLAGPFVQHLHAMHKAVIRWCSTRVRTWDEFWRTWTARILDSDFGTEKHNERKFKMFICVGDNMMRIQFCCYQTLALFTRNFQKLTVAFGSRCMIMCRSDEAYHTSI